MSEITNTLNPSQRTFLALPPVIQETIMDPKTFEIIEKIAKNNGLDRVETGYLAQNVGALMQGMLGPKDFIAAIMEDLSLPQLKASAIAQEVNRDLFNPIKDALKELHSRVGAAPAAQAPVAPAIEEKKELPKLDIPFSVSSALGNDAGPAATQPAAPAGVISNGVAEPHVGNIFEQKLGGSFRMKSDEVKVEGNAGLRVPHKPKEVVPPAPVQSPPHDPYREAVI